MLLVSKPIVANTQHREEDEEEDEGEREVAARRKRARIGPRSGDLQGMKARHDSLEPLRSKPRGWCKFLYHNPSLSLIFLKLGTFSKKAGPS